MHPRGAMWDTCHVSTITAHCISPLYDHCHTCVSVEACISSDVREGGSHSNGNGM